MTVLVTGASGHLSAHLIRRLVTEGCSVRAFVRPTSELPALSHLGIDIRRGDVIEPGSLQTAMSGCDVVFHLAAPTRVVPGLTEAIVSGTRNVLTCASRCGVSAVVYTSSIVTVGYSNRPEVILDERSYNNSVGLPYHAAKYAAEQIVLEWARKGHFKTIVVNPATIVGSLDYRVTPSNEPIERALTKSLPFTFDAGVTIAPVADVAMGHILALRHGKSGERYILGGERLTITEYFRLIDACCGRDRAARIRLPRSVMLGIGGAFSVAKLLGAGRVPFTFTQARQLIGKYGFYSSHKAFEELGYRWRPAKDAINDYVQWVRAGRLRSTEPIPNEPPTIDQ
jgi:dihydroflavonol-4-reductase